MGTVSKISADVMVVGAGLAGTVAAAVLGRKAKVILVDPRPTCPPVFKAEKIDQEQVRILRKFGLLDCLLPYSGQVKEVRVAYDGRVIRSVSIEQYGIGYPDMVNAVRTCLPATVEFRLGRVESIANAADVQRVRLADGREICSRLVVLASGVSNHLLANLRMRRRVVRKDQCAVLGFTIKPTASPQFDFDSVTYYPLEPSTRIDYLTLFKFRDAMRANLFVFRSAHDPWIREFICQPEAMLQRHLPKLPAVTGPLRVNGGIESGRADLYKVEGNPQPGIVLIGDACQSACPSTGMGLEKILNDVEVLSEYVPHWLSTPGMAKDKTTEYYADPRKCAVDARALWRADRQRRAATDTSLAWRTHRLLRQLKWRWMSAVQPRQAESAAPVMSATRDSTSVKRRDSGGDGTSARATLIKFGSVWPTDLVTHDLSVPGRRLTLETGRFSAGEWAHVLGKFEDANLYQSWPYAAVRWGPRRLRHLVLKENKEILAAAQIVVTRIPFFAVGLAYMKWGPLSQNRTSGASLDNFRYMLAALRQVSAQSGVMVRVTPWEFEDHEARTALCQFGFELNPAAESLRTAVLDLAYSVDELRASLSKHWRYNLKMAERNELEIRAGSSKDLSDEFSIVYEQMRSRRGVDEIPQMGYLPEVQRQLPEGLKLRVMICRHAGAPVAGLVVSAMGSKAFAVAAATGTDGLQLRGSYFLQWRMIEWLKARNVRWYDLARINPKTHPGTTQFKLGLAGKLGSTPEYLGEFQSPQSWSSQMFAGFVDRLRPIYIRVR